MVYDIRPLPFILTGVTSCYILEMPDGEAYSLNLGGLITGIELT